MDRISEVMALYKAILRASSGNTRKELLALKDIALNPLARLIETHRADASTHPALARFIAEEGPEEPAVHAGPRVLGGATTITQPNQEFRLGDVRVGQFIQVTCQPRGGTANVDVRLYMPLAGAPIGCWSIGAPGSARLQMMGTCADTTGSIGTWAVIVAISNTAPVDVVFNDA